MATALMQRSEISQDAFDLIVNEEVGSEAYYEAHYQHPDWPGGASGVTFGVGYDAGYCTATQVHLDWSAVLPIDMVQAMASVAGIKGSPAHSHAQELRNTVTVPWDAAIKVFSEVDVPRWTGNVQRSLPNTDKLSPDSFGALVSLAFNRGCSFTLPGDRYTEMRAIKAHMDAQNFSMIPGDIRAMKRLWPSCKDLRDRRDHEADLFQKGLTS